MPLPLSIDPSGPVDTDSPSEGDNEFRALKDFIASVFGLPLATNVTAAAFAITAGGLVTASQSPFTTKDILATVGTITTDKPVLKGTETWNAAGVTFNAIDIDVTDTASAAASLLLNIKKATTAQLTLNKNGVLTALGNVQSDANLAFKSGTAFLGTLDHAISEARVWTLPDATGTVLTTGNPTDLTAVGTITSGTWNATAVGSQWGGTGINTSASTGVPSISAGTWSVAAALAASLGGTGINTSGSSGLPHLSAGTWSVSTTQTPQVARLGLGQAADASAVMASTGQYFSTNKALSDGATIALDWNDGNVQYVTLGGNRILTFANPKNGGRYVLFLKQDGTGTRLISSWPTITWRGGSAPTLTTTINKGDIITLMYINGVYYGDAVKNF